MEKKEKIKKAIYDLIKERGYVSFVEIERIDNCKGEYTFELADKNIILWTDLSLECIDSLRELLKSKKIIWKATNTLIYLADGKCLTLPLPKTNRKYVKPRWIPVIFNIYKGDKIK